MKTINNILGLIATFPVFAIWVILFPIAFF